MEKGDITRICLLGTLVLGLVLFVVITGGGVPGWLIGYENKASWLCAMMVLVCLVALARTRMNKSSGRIGRIRPRRHFGLPHKGKVDA